MPNVTLDLSTITTVHTIKPGDLIVVSLPLGLKPKEAELIQESVSELAYSLDASAVTLTAGLTMEVYADEALRWLCDNGCALRCYLSDEEPRYRVLHEVHGQLSDEGNWPEAITAAKDTLALIEAPAP